MPTRVVTIYYLTILCFAKNLNLNPANHHIELNSIYKKQKANNLQLLYPTIFGHPLFKPVFLSCPQALQLEVPGVVNNSWG